MKFNVYNIEVHLKILKTTVSIFETALKPGSISKNGQHEKDAQFPYLFNGISFASFGKNGLKRKRKKVCDTEQKIRVRKFTSR